MVRTPMRGLLCQEVPIAVLALAPADDLVHVLTGVLAEQVFVRAHATSGQNDGFRRDVHDVALGVLVLHARDGVLVVGEQCRGPRLGADIDALFFGDGSERGDARRSVAAFVEHHAGPVPAHTVLRE